MPRTIAGMYRIVRGERRPWKFQRGVDSSTDRLRSKPTEISSIPEIHRPLKLFNIVRCLDRKAAYQERIPLQPICPAGQVTNG